MLITTPQEIQLEQAQIVTIFGVRMKEAREMCVLSQLLASKRLGYANSSKLNKLERASDTNSVPLWIILNASDTYNVSTDYLLGSSDSWERDPVVSQQRQVGQWLLDHWERAKVAEVNAIHVLHNKQIAILKALSHALTRSKANLALAQRVQQMNPTFND